MNTYHVEVDSDKTVKWYNNATEKKLHRIGGPAIEYINGYKAWYLHGQRHRVDGPAVEYANGNKEWYLNGQLHRVDGPAVEYAYGYKAWYLNGQLHRVDGPAIEFANGNKSWYLNGQKLSEADHKAATSKDPCDGKVVEIDGKKYKLTAV